jgi:hypothetical protein
MKNTLILSFGYSKKISKETRNEEYVIKKR